MKERNNVVRQFNPNHNNNNNNNNNRRRHKLNSGQRMLLIIVAVFAVMLIGYTAFSAFSKAKDDTRGEVANENISAELRKDKTYEGLEIKDIQIESTESLTHLMANITNTKEEAFPAGMVYIVFLDQSEKEIGRTETYIDEVAPKGEIRIDTVIDKNYKSAYNFKVEPAK